MQPTRRLIDAERRVPRGLVARSTLVKRLVGELETLRAEAGRLRAVNAELAEKVSTDPLTGVGSRRAWEDALAGQELHRSRSGAPVSVVIVDLDDLKVVNDEVGHVTGDELLRRCGRLLAQSVRATDLVARIGGDEFGVLLRYTDAAQVKAWCARLEEARREMGDRLLSLSLGSASVPPCGTIMDAVHEADRQMYKMKKLAHSARRSAAV